MFVDRAKGFYLFELSLAVQGFDVRTVALLDKVLQGIQTNKCIKKNALSGCEEKLSTGV